MNAEIVATIPNWFYFFLIPNTWSFHSKLLSNCAQILPNHVAGRWIWRGRNTSATRRWWEQNNPSGETVKDSGGGQKGWYFLCQTVHLVYTLCGRVKWMFYTVPVDTQSWHKVAEICRKYSGRQDVFHPLVTLSMYARAIFPPSSFFQALRVSDLKSSMEMTSTLVHFLWMGKLTSEFGTPLQVLPIFLSLPSSTPFQPSRKIWIRIKERVTSPLSPCFPSP